MNSSWYSNLVPVLTPFSNFFKYLVGLAMMLIISNQNQPSVGMIVAAVANAHTAIKMEKKVIAAEQSLKISMEIVQIKHF